MYNLLRFIKINHFFLLFVLIEGFSIFLLINNNNYQSNRLIKASVQYKGYINNYISIYSDYFSLKKINNQLASENAKLNSLLYKQSFIIDSLNLNTNKFNYLSAKIINNSINKRNNFFTLNKGRVHGIKEGMGVITNKGTIGIVHSVSQNYSVGLSLLHQKSSISVKLKKNSHNGILKWNGFDYRAVSRENFPNHIPISLGDTITTNSHSTIFPEDIDIGKVSYIKKNKEDGFYNTTVSLFEDFNKLNYVYIIYSNEKSEQLQLEKKINIDE